MPKENCGYEKVVHPFEPVYDNNSKILILGTMASVKSRQVEFYYGHPQNRFWKLMANILSTNEPKTVDEKKKLLISNNIALWDVIQSCEIIGSDDSSIKNVEVNEISRMLNCSAITKIYTNGKKADALYEKYCLSSTKIKSTCLPSTSPANAVFTFDKLLDTWKIII